MRKGVRFLIYAMVFLLLGFAYNDGFCQRERTFTIRPFAGITFAKVYDSRSIFVEQHYISETIANLTRGISAEYRFSKGFYVISGYQKISLGTEVKHAYFEIPVREIKYFLDVKNDYDMVP